VVIRSIKTGYHDFLDPNINQPISCLSISKDGRFLATGHESNETVQVEIVIWDLKNAVEELNHPKKNDDTLTNTKSNKPKRCMNGYLLHRLYQHRGRVQDIDFSFDGSFLVTLGGQDDNDIVVWDVQTGRAICGSPAASETARCVKWLHHRNDRFVTCGNFHFRVWQVCTKTPTLHPVDASMGSIRRVMQCLCISDNDEFAFVGSKTGEVLKFSLERDELKNALCGPEEAIPSLRTYNQDRFSQGVKAVACVVNPLTGNTNIIAGAGDGTVQLLNPKLQIISSHCAKLVGAIMSITLSPCDGKSFQVGTEYSHRYNIDIATFKQELRSTGHYSSIYDVQFPKHSSDIFVTSSDNDIRVWNAKKNQELIQIKVHNSSCFALYLTSSGSCIISGWSDGKIRGFYPESGKIKFTIPDAHPESVTALVACDEEAEASGLEWRIISGGKEGAVRVWKVRENHQYLQHSMKEHKGPVNGLVYNANGSQAISASSDGCAIVWDLVKGVRIHALFEPSAFTDVLIHPDESQYLSCSANGKIGYWDAFDGSGIRLIEGGDSEMTCLDIYRDGTLFVSGSADRSVRVWHYDDGLTIALGRVHSGTVKSIAISPDHKKLVSVGSEGGIFIWDISAISNK
jgi:WD40 repeat protein